MDATTIFTEYLQMLEANSDCTHTLTHTDLPENAVAGVSTRGEATEAKSLFALNVSQHKCEVLADLVDCQAAG